MDIELLNDDYLDLFEGVDDSQLMKQDEKQSQHLTIGT